MFSAKTPLFFRKQPEFFTHFPENFFDIRPVLFH